jgi:exonuclease III
MLKKITAITMLCTDIIFLSDIRLGNRHNLDDLKRAFLYNDNCSYNFVYNSTKNSRGVGILIKNSISVTGITEFRDENENILGISGSVDNFIIRLVAVYGPNTNDNTFFQELSEYLNTNPGMMTIMGGDWNLTMSTNESRFNIDTFAMQSPPSIYRSRALQHIYSELQLSDPYRLLHPDKRDFTFIPRNGQHNRSRIDFFLITDNLLPLVKSCDINPCLSTTLFDHKPVILKFSRDTGSTNQSINKNTYLHPRYEFLLSATVYETYLHHAAVNFPTQDPLLQVGNILNNFKDINDLELDIELYGTNVEKNNRLDLLKNNIATLHAALPDPATIGEIPLAINHDLFFDTLTNNVMNCTKSFQGFLQKKISARRCKLAREVDLLKESYQVNFGEIHRIEGELTRLTSGSTLSTVRLTILMAPLLQ